MLGRLATLDENKVLGRRSSSPNMAKAPCGESKGLRISRRQNSMGTLNPGIQRSNPGLTGKSPSLVGLLASKRFARQLTMRFFGRTNNTYSSRYSSTTKSTPAKEPSYRMEPQNKFNQEKVQTIIKEVIDERLKGYKYHPQFCSTMCKVLCEELKDKVKKLKFDRYKIVAVVHLGEKRDQSVLVTSRCAWDQDLDGFATYTYDTPTLFCTASVYGIYNE